MREVIIETEAMTKFEAAVDDALDKEHGLSGFIPAYGQAGRGKTEAAKRYYTLRGGAYVYVWQDWTQTAFLQRLLFEVRGENGDIPRHSGNRCKEYIVRLVGGKPGTSQGCNAHSCISCRYTPSANEGSCNASLGYTPITGVAMGGEVYLDWKGNSQCRHFGYWYLNGTTPPGAKANVGYGTTTNGAYYTGELMCAAYSDCGVAAARYQICGAI